MAGILDSKSRIIDVVITEQGRRQLASGKMKIEFATFTDAGAFYADGGNGVIEDPTGRIYFEAASDMPSDMITLESDDSDLLPFRSDNVSSGGGSLLISGSVADITDPSGSAQAITDAIFQNWNNLQAIGSIDPIDDTQGFALSNNVINYSIRNDFPFTSSDVQVAVIDDIEGLNHDVRLSNLKNFKYLPPVNGAGTLAGQPIGDFPNTNETLDSDIQALETRLAGLEYNDIIFTQTSIENNFVMQAFEMSGDRGIVKLDVIDFGERPSSADPQKIVRTLFAGKILRDGYDNPTFINIFTIELS